MREEGTRATKQGYTAVEAFLADLLRAALKGDGFAYRSLKKDTFTGEAVGHRTFSFLLKSFADLGWLEHITGKKYWRAYCFDSSLPPIATGGQASHFRMTPELKALCDSASVTQDHFVEPLPKRPVVLRASSIRRGRWKTQGRKMSLPSDERTLRLEEQMRELNEFLNQFELKPYRFTGLVRSFNEGDSPSFNWNKGGRLYACGELNYQQQGKDDRHTMTIDGEPVVELDIRASYLAVFHGLMNEPFDPTVDPYEIEGIERDAVKLWTTATFGNNGHINRWPHCEKSKEFKKKHGKSIGQVVKVQEVREAMVAKFPILAKWGRSGHTWADLMFYESGAVFASIFMLMKVHRVPSYPVHDSLIVRVRDTEVAKAFLKQSYKASLKVDVEVR